MRGLELVRKHNIEHKFNYGFAEKTMRMVNNSSESLYFVLLHSLMLKMDVVSSVIRYAYKTAFTTFFL